MDSCTPEFGRYEHEWLESTAHGIGPTWVCRLCGEVRARHTEEPGPFAVRFLGDPRSFRICRSFVQPHKGGWEEAEVGGKRVIVNLGQAYVVEQYDGP